MFCGVGGGLTNGVRSASMAAYVEHQGAYGVVCNSKIGVETIHAIKDAVEILRGESAGPLLTVSLALGAQLLTVGGVAANPEEGEAMLRRALADGSGLEKLRQLIRAQGGDESVCDHPEALADAPIVRDVAAPRAGVIARMDTTLLGYAAQEPETGRCFGRTYADSPDIDGRVLFSAARSVVPGEFVMVRITGAEDGDLVGEMEENA